VSECLLPFAFCTSCFFVSVFLFVWFLFLSSSKLGVRHYLSILISCYRRTDTLTSRHTHTHTHTHMHLHTYTHTNTTTYTHCVFFYASAGSFLNRRMQRVCHTGRKPFFCLSSLAFVRFSLWYVESGCFALFHVYVKRNPLGGCMVLLSLPHTHTHTHTHTRTYIHHPPLHTHTHIYTIHHIHTQHVSSGARRTTRRWRRHQHCENGWSVSWSSMYASRSRWPQTRF
jgi:hypothetical protein